MRALRAGPRKCVRDVGSFCSALLPSTAMAGLSVYLSVVSAVLLHSCAGWIRLKHRWGGRATISEHGRASLYSLTDARPEPGSHALSLPDASRPFVVWDAGTRPMEAAPAESPPPLPAPDRRETKGHNALDVSGFRVDDKSNYLKEKEAFLTMLRKQIVSS